MKLLGSFLVAALIIVGLLLYRKKMDNIKNITPKEMIHAISSENSSDDITSRTVRGKLSKMRKVPVNKKEFLERLRSQNSIYQWAQTLSDQEKSNYYNIFLSTNDEDEIIDLLILIQKIGVGNDEVLRKILTLAVENNTGLRTYCLRAIFHYKPKNDFEKEMIFHSLNKMAFEKNSDFMASAPYLAYLIDKKRSIAFNKKLLSQVSKYDEYERRVFEKGIKLYIKKAEDDLKMQAQSASQ